MEILSWMIDWTVSGGSTLVFKVDGRNSFFFYYFSSVICGWYNDLFVMRIGAHHFLAMYFAMLLGLRLGWLLLYLAMLWGNNEFEVEPKSEMVPVGTVPGLQALAPVIRFKVSSLPLNYLGLLLGSSFKAHNLRNGIIGWMETRLARWKKLYPL